MVDFVLSTSILDISPPRQMNAQVVVLEYGVEDDTLRVLIQKRSNRMSVMPGYLGAVGGMRDRTDADSRVTACREVAEETGLRSGIALQPSKFAEGAKVDWYVMRLERPVFAEKAADQWECGDIDEAMPFLPPTSVRAECYGHAWVPVADLHMIQPCQKLMGGLIQRIGEAVHHIGLGSHLSSSHVLPKGKGHKGASLFSNVGKGLSNRAFEALTVERAQGLPREMQGNLVAFQLALATPWRVFGPGGESFNWDAADANSVSEEVKSNAKSLLQAYADENAIQLFGLGFVRIALKYGDFWVSFKGGVAHAKLNQPCSLIVIDE